MTNSKFMILVMLTVSMLTPFGNDIFLASMPQIQQVFSVLNVGSMLSVYLLGLALGQLFYGPLFDYFGRKPVLIVGLLIYAVGTLIVLFAMHFPVLLLGRFIQAIGACSTTVAVMSIIKDSFVGDEMTKYIAILFGFIAVCPTVSPIIGSYLQIHFGWQGSFTLLLIFSIFYAVVTLFFFKETMVEKNRTALHPGNIVKQYYRCLTHVRYFCYVLISCCSYALLFAYISITPILFIKTFHFSVHAFAWLFFLTAIVVLIMNFIAPRLSKKIGLKYTAILGVCLLVLGVVLMYIFVKTMGLNIASIMTSATVLLTGIGLIRPTAAAGAMHIFPKTVAGSASALFLFFSFIGGMISTYFAGKYIAVSFNDVLITLSVFAAIAVCAAVTLYFSSEAAYK